jgi:hypothetical protein
MSNAMAIKEYKLERKRSCPSLYHYSGLCLEGLRRTTKKLSHDGQSPVRDLKSGHPKYLTYSHISNDVSVV